MDPTEAFLARLADIKIDFRKGSRVKGVKEPFEKATSQNVFDRETNEPGALIREWRLHLLDDGTVEVAAEWHTGSLRASGGSYILEKANGGWRIVKSVVSWEA